MGRDPLADLDTTGVLEGVHSRLIAASDDTVLSKLSDAHTRAAATRATAGDGVEADRLAAELYVTDVLIELAADGRLDPDTTKLALAVLSEETETPLHVVELSVYLRLLASSRLRDLPPVIAVEISIEILVHLELAADVSVWRTAPGGADLVVATSVNPGHDAEHAAASALRSRRGGRSGGSSDLRAATVTRLDKPYAVLVGRTRTDGDTERLDGYLERAAQALATALQHDQLMERGRDRERALVGSGEKRLMRLAFDLHDGPVQDVLALVSDIKQFRDQLDPYVAESHRELAQGRFEDMVARLGDVDSQLRELAHSLESRSIISRPLGEILHREVDVFALRSGIDARLEIKGDPDSLSSAQRIAVFRVIQESLANVREHAGATEVDILLAARRNAIEVSIIDNGHGFEVGRALARAAQRGRLGLVGMGERVRLLGGTFVVDSQPGGPTVLWFTLPRWEPLNPDGM
jgi:signal transduction histidine kinase